jgi:hypothetical protein
MSVCNHLGISGEQRPFVDDPFGFAHGPFDATWLADLDPGAYPDVSLDLLLQHERTGVSGSRG